MKAFFRFIHENQLISSAVILVIALVVCFHIDAQCGRFSYLRGEGWNSQRVFDTKTGSLYILKEKLLSILSVSPNVTTADLVGATGLSTSRVEKNLRELKAAGKLRRVGPDRGGHWEVVKVASS